MGFRVPNLINSLVRPLKNTGAQIQHGYLQQPVQQEKNTSLLVTEMTELAKFASPETFNSIVLIYQNYHENTSVFDDNTLLTEDIFRLKELKERYLSDTVRIFLKQRRDLKSEVHTGPIKLLNDAFSRQIDVLKRSSENIFKPLKEVTLEAMEINGNFLAEIFPEEAVAVQEEILQEENLRKKQDAQKIQDEKAEIILNSSLEIAEETLDKESSQVEVPLVQTQILVESKIQEQEKIDDLKQKLNEKGLEKFQNKFTQEQREILDWALFEGARRAKKTPEEITNFYWYLEKTGLLSLMLDADIKKNKFIIHAIGTCNSARFLKELSRNIQSTLITPVNPAQRVLIEDYKGISLQSYKQGNIFYGCTLNAYDNKIKAQYKEVDKPSKEISVDEWLYHAKYTLQNEKTIVECIQVRNKQKELYYNITHELLAPYLNKVRGVNWFNNPLIKICQTPNKLETITITYSWGMGEKKVATLSPISLDEPGFFEKRKGLNKDVASNYLSASVVSYKENGEVYKEKMLLSDFQDCLDKVLYTKDLQIYLLNKFEDSQKKPGGPLLPYESTGYSIHDIIHNKEPFQAMAQDGLQKFASYIPEDTKNVGIFKDIFGKVNHIEVLNAVFPGTYTVLTLSKNNINEHTYGLFIELRAEGTKKQIYKKEYNNLKHFANLLEFQMYQTQIEKLKTKEEKILESIKETLGEDIVNFQYKNTKIYHKQGVDFKKILLRCNFDKKTIILKKKKNGEISLLINEILDKKIIDTCDINLKPPHGTDNSWELESNNTSLKTAFEIFSKNLLEGNNVYGSTNEIKKIEKLPVSPPIHAIATYEDILGIKKEILENKKEEKITKLPENKLKELDKQLVEKIQDKVHYKEIRTQNTSKRVIDETPGDRNEIDVPFSRAVEFLADTKYRIPHYVNTIYYDYNDNRDITKIYYETSIDAPPDTKKDLVKQYVMEITQTGIKTYAEIKNKNEEPYDGENFKTETLTIRSFYTALDGKIEKIKEKFDSQENNKYDNYSKKLAAVMYLKKGKPIKDLTTQELLSLAKIKEQRKGKEKGR